MANSIDATFPELWATEFQDSFYKVNVGMKICEFVDMNYGDTYHRAKRGTSTIQQITIGTDMTPRSISATDESLTIDQKWGDFIEIEDFENDKSMYDLALRYGKDCSQAVSDKIDADVLYEVINSASYVDGGDVGGTAATGIVLTAANAIDVFAAAKMKLKKQKVTSSDLFCVVSPEFERFLTTAVANRDTIQGDEVGMNGYIGKYRGVKLYTSNNLTCTNVLAMATQPIDGDTVVIQGVTFTFKTTLGSTAGNVLIGASADAARANLTALINAPATTTAQGVALSSANQALFVPYFTAVNNDTANTMTLYGKGQGATIVSETFTDGTDTWTATLSLQRCLFGVVGNPALALISKPKLTEKDVPKRLAKWYIIAAQYGLKTYADNSRNMVDIRINASTYSYVA